MHSTFWIPRKSYTTILEPAWYSASGFLHVKQTQFSGVARGSRFDSLLFGSKMQRQISSFFTRNNDPESNRCLHYNPIKKDNLHVKYLIDSALLAIVRTTNSIVKFDSSTECPGWKIILATGLNDLPYLRLSLVWMFCGITRCVKGCSSGLSVSLGNTFKNRVWQIHTKNWNRF